MLKFGVVALAAGLIVLALIFNAVDPRHVLEALRQVPPEAVCAALVLVQVQIVLSAIRWRFTANRLGHHIPLPRAIREYYLSSALNLVLPGGVSGDALRAYRSRTGAASGWKRPATAVLLERISGQAVFLLLTGCGLIAWPLLLSGRLPDTVSGLLWGLVLVVAGLAVGALIVARTRLSARLAALKPEMEAVFWRDGAFAVQVGLSVVITAGYVATFLIASAAVGAPLPAIAALTAVPLCLLTMLIPAGIGGWGTRELAAAALWPVFGFSAAQGLSASLLYGTLSLVGAALPGLCFGAWAMVRGHFTRA